MKKFLAILLAAMMLLAMTAAFAEDVDTFTITAPASDVSHTYEIYQIFTGDLAITENDDKILSNIVWGINGDGTKGEAVDEGLLAELKGENGVDKINGCVNFDSDPYATVTSGNKVEKVPAGYYLIMDAEKSLDGQHDAYTAYIVNVCGDVEVKAKSVYPTVDKEVLDETTDAEVGHDNGWGETADHAINEVFSYRLTATLPASERYDDYETYKVVFNDTMSDGITFDEIVSVTINNKPITNYVCTATNGQAGGSWTLTIEDVKTITDINLTENDAVIVVVYKAHLNEEAVVYGDDGENKNTVFLTYSNNPNAEGMGKTNEDHVWVFTYSVDNVKYRETIADGNEMGGAGFTLIDADGSPVKLIDNGDGTYTVANKDAEVGGNVVTQMVSAENTGKFTIIGLDHGTYTLTETDVPDGYNKCKDVEITIAADHVEDTTEESATVDMDASENMANNIPNKSGATLPETGGIGTTLFYLLGGLMTAGSALILVVRRRADAEEE